MMAEANFLRDGLFRKNMFGLKLFSYILDYLFPIFFSAGYSPSKF